MTLRHAHAYDGRAEPRDETLHRLLASEGGGATYRLVIVNLSPHGFMARTERDMAVGQTVTVQLPIGGRFEATVRWALGGRIGCLLDREVAPALYDAVLAAMRG